MRLGFPTFQVRTLGTVSAQPQTGAERRSLAGAVGRRAAAWPHARPCPASPPSQPRLQLAPGACFPGPGPRFSLVNLQLVAHACGQCAKPSPAVPGAQAVQLDAWDSQPNSTR